MDLWTATKVVMRRWAIVIPALILTGVIAFVVTSRLAPSYSAQGTVEFLSSNGDNKINPYDAINPSLQTTATLVGTSVSSEQTREKFAKAGLDHNYKIISPYDPARTTAGTPPSLELSVTTSSPAITLVTLQRLSTEVTNELKRRQEASGAPRPTWIQAHPAAMDTSATKQSGSKNKVLALIVLLGIAVSISLAFFAESLTSDSRKKRAAAALGPADADPSGHAAPPTGTEAADGVLLARALDAMRVALDVAEETAQRTGAAQGTGANPAALPAETGAPANGNGNGARKPIPTEGIDPKRTLVRVRPEGTGATQGSKPGPLPVARPDEGDRPSPGGRAS